MAIAGNETAFARGREVIHWGGGEDRRQNTKPHNYFLIQSPAGQYSSRGGVQDSAGTSRETRRDLQARRGDMEASVRPAKNTFAW